MTDAPKDFFAQKKFFSIIEVQKALECSPGQANTLVIKGSLGPILEIGVGKKRKRRKVLSANVKKYLNGDFNFLPLDTVLESLF